MHTDIPPYIRAVIKARIAKVMNMNYTQALLAVMPTLEG